MEVTKDRFSLLAFRLSFYSVPNLEGTRSLGSAKEYEPKLRARSEEQERKPKAKGGRYDICHSRSLTIATTGQPGNDR